MSHPGIVVLYSETLDQFDQGSTRSAMQEAWAKQAHTPAAPELAPACIEAVKNQHDNAHDYLRWL